MKKEMKTEYVQAAIEYANSRYHPTQEPIENAIAEQSFLDLNKKGNYTIYPSTKTKFKVFQRDNYTCQYCGSNDKILIADHVIPSLNGGHGCTYNLVACCQSCNQSKKKNTWVPKNIDVLRSENKEWAEMIEKGASFRIPKAINLTVLAEHLNMSKQLLNFKIKNGMSDELKSLISAYIKSLTL